MPSLVNVTGGTVTALDDDKPLALANVMIRQSAGVGFNSVPVAAWYPESGGVAGNFSGTVDTSSDRSQTFFEGNYAWNGDPSRVTEPDSGATSTYAWHLVFDFTNFPGGSVTWDQVMIFGHNFNDSTSITDLVDFLAANSISDVQTISSTAFFSIGNAITPGSANPVIYSPYKSGGSSYTRADTYRYLQIRFSASGGNYSATPPSIGEVVVGQRIQLGRRAVRPYQSDAIMKLEETFVSDSGNTHRFTKAVGMNVKNYRFQLEPSPHPEYSINDETEFLRIRNETENYSRPLAWVELPTTEPNRVGYYHIETAKWDAPYTEQGAVRDFNLKMNELPPYYEAELNGW